MLIAGTKAGNGSQASSLRGGASRTDPLLDLVDPSEQANPNGCDQVSPENLPSDCAAMDHKEQLAKR